MATDLPITGFPDLPAGSVADADALVIVDVSDTSSSSAGTTKSTTRTALLTSPTITTPAITGGTSSGQTLTASTITAPAISSPTVTGPLSMATAAATIVGGATALSLMAHDGTTSNVTILDNGDITLRGNLNSAKSVTGADLAANAGSVQISGDPAQGGHIYLTASTTVPSPLTNGMIWYDGTNLKMRIGGVTKTFTLT